MHRMSLSSLLFKGSLFPGKRSLILGVSAEGLESSSFEGVQVPSTQCKYAAGAATRSNETGELVRW